MREMIIKLYQFEELSAEAKEKAREWMREAESRDFDPSFEPYETAAKLLGIELGEQSGQADIRYSGFWSQGDGASFVGSYEYAAGCVQAVREEFPTDTKLHAIADGLTARFAAALLLGKRLGAAQITQSGRYVHKHTMALDLPDASDNVTAADEDALLTLMRDFAQWIYDGLEAEYNYRQSNEAIDETIEANEYEFTEDGERA
jgi:hypothetical protein